jgi:hypothetical protein
MRCKAFSSAAPSQRNSFTDGSAGSWKWSASDRKHCKLSSLRRATFVRVGIALFWLLHADKSLGPERTEGNALVEGIGKLLSRTLGEEIELTMELDPTARSLAVTRSSIGIRSL